MTPLPHEAAQLPACDQSYKQQQPVKLHRTAFGNRKRYFSRRRAAPEREGALSAVLFLTFGSQSGVNSASERVVRDALCSRGCECDIFEKVRSHIFDAKKRAVKFDMAHGFNGG